ncbi:MAG: restriction endonuclease subunit S [Thermoguttaceae bacterium]|nr:restriction endonuclease subunit S [Thermoguttaceae bacterium]
MTRAMKDSGVEWIGRIPEGWRTIRLGSLYRERKEKVSDYDYPPLSVTMKGILPQLSTAAKTDAHDDRKLVRKGDFAINSRSDRRGSCGISPFDGSVSLINIILEPREEIQPVYYEWLFHSSMFSDEFYKWGHGIVDDLWTTNWQDMKKISVPAPSYSEQQRIADFLDAKCARIDAVIEQTRASIEEYKKLKQAVITRAVTKGLRPDRPMKDSGIEWIGKIPSTWDMVKLKYLLSSDKVNLRVGPFGSSLSGTDFTSEGLWVYNQRVVLDNNFEVNDVFINDKKFEELRGFEVLPEDVLITTRGSIGRVAIVPLRAEKGILHPCVIKFRINKEMISHLLIWHIFNNTDIAMRQIKDMSNSTTIEVLYSYSLKNVQIPRIPRDEWTELEQFMATTTKKYDHIIDGKKHLLTELENYKKSLIFEYVTGKREVL